MAGLNYLWFLLGLIPIAEMIRRYNKTRDNQVELLNGHGLSFTNPMYDSSNPESNRGLDHSPSANTGHRWASSIHYNQIY